MKKKTACIVGVLIAFIVLLALLEYYRFSPSIAKAALGGGAVSDIALNRCGIQYSRRPVTSCSEGNSIKLIRYSIDFREVMRMSDIHASSGRVLFFRFKEKINDSYQEVDRILWSRTEKIGYQSGQAVYAPAASSHVTAIEFLDRVNVASKKEYFLCDGSVHLHEVSPFNIAILTDGAAGGRLARYFHRQVKRCEGR